MLAVRRRAALGDARVRVVLATRLVTLAAAPIILLLVITRLLPAERGLYFIFVNFVALAQLFEIGIGALIVQYASHELAYLTWGAQGSLHGDSRALESLQTVLRRSLRWYSAAALVAIGVGLPFGAWLFPGGLDRVWVPITPLWAITVAATAAYLPMIPLLNTIEAGGRFVEVQRMRLVQATAVALAALLLIPNAGGLIAVAVGAVVQWAVAAGWIWQRYPGVAALGWNAAILRDNRKGPLTPELRRLQSTQLQTAAIWLSAHIAAQSLTPLLLYYRGAAAAAQIGASLAVCVVPYTIGMAWLQGRFPDYGALASRGRHNELATTAARATTEASFVCITVALLIVAAVGSLERFAPDLGERLLPLSAVAALAVASLVSLLLQAMAAYMRAYRAEPLLSVLIASYAAMVAAAWFAAARIGPAATAIAYSAVGAGMAIPATALALRVERRRLLDRAN